MTAKESKVLTHARQPARVNLQDTKMQTFTVLLSHAPNPDIRSGEARGYWVDPQDKGRKTLVPVNSIAEASTVCRAYISKRGLGGGNWTGGELRDGNDVIIGRVAYNGRVFSPATPGNPAGDDGECIWETI